MLAPGAATRARLLRRLSDRTGMIARCKCECDRNCAAGIVAAWVQPFWVSGRGLKWSGASQSGPELCSMMSMQEPMSAQGARLAYG
jgi:hypothetical protein